MSCTPLSSKKAFSLVELIVVMGIVAVLATMAIPTLTQYTNKTKSGRAAADIRTIEKAVIAYALDKNTLPATLNVAGINQLDPWERPYEYAAIGSGPPPLENFLAIPLNSDFDLYSKGVDGASAASAADPTSSDDIIRSNDGGFAGLRTGL